MAKKNADMRELFCHRPEVAIGLLLPGHENLGRVWVDQSRIYPTAGAGRTLPPPSMCRLFQEGRCHVGEDCNQVHVQRSWIRKIRAHLIEHPVSMCCPLHGDGDGNRRPTLLQASVVEVCQKMTADGGGSGPLLCVPVSLERVSHTRFWAAGPRSWSSPALWVDCDEGTLRIFASQICQKHQRDPGTPS